MKKHFKTIVASGLLLIGSMTSALAVSLPGIPESGPLNFDFNELSRPAGSLKEALWKIAHNRIELTQPVAGITLFRAINAGRFVFTALDGTLYEGTNGNFQLNATFGADGTLAGGTVVITGAIAGIGISTPQLLMSADLTAFATDNGLVGFATGNVFCNAVYAADCFANESVYLRTGLSTGPDGLGSLQASSLAATLSSSSTTVPLPASAWLLLSAFGALVGLSRGRRSTATAA